jgi:sec-independent protein translocase protein TatA
MTALFAFFEGGLSPSHILVVLIVGFLLFGRKLPEMGRSLGKGIVEFKKGLRGLEDEVEAVASPQAPPPRVATAPRLEGPGGAGGPPPA